MKFSIITCTYNSGLFIEKNIASVESQTHTDYEHIFIDALSTDKTIEIIKKYQTRHPDRVKLFQHPPKGIANAMNKGIENASGEYLIHLHADDTFYDDNVLFDTFTFIKKTGNPDWIYGKSNFFNLETQKGRLVPHRKIYHKIRFWLLLLTNYVPHQAVFIKKETFEKHGMFDESLKCSMDYDLWLKLSNKKTKSVFFNRTISNFSIHPGQQSEIEKGHSESSLSQRKYIRNPIILSLLKSIHTANSKRKLF